MKNVMYALSAFLLVFTMNTQAQELKEVSTSQAVTVVKTEKKVNDAAKAYVSYDVRIELVDENTGQPVDPQTLPGYAAKNLDTNQWYYPSYYDYNEFSNLPEGTYRFVSYDGYFDGSSSEVVTLSSGLEGNDGFIVVTLRYWSE